MAATLAPFTDDHLSREYVSWLNDPEVVKYSEQRHMTHDLGTCQNYVWNMRKNGELWAILHGSVHIGNISAHIDGPNRLADVSILIGRWRGKGFGYQALKIACKLLKDGGIRRITLGTMSRNKPMIAIAQKTGFKIEAVRQKHFLVDKKGVSLVEMGKFV